MGLAEDQPVTMLAPGMVGNLPLGVDNRALSDLDNAVARTKSKCSGRLDKINMSPLVLVIVDVVADLAEQDTFRL